MADNDKYKNVSLSNDTAKRIDKLAIDRRKEVGGKWRRPTVIDFLLDFHEKHANNPSVKKG